MLFKELLLLLSSFALKSGRSRSVAERIGIKEVEFAETVVVIKTMVSESDREYYHRAIRIVVLGENTKANFVDQILANAGRVTLISGGRMLLLLVVVVVI